ncbi:hypothetical protein OSTOST_05486, partial [Ostertagia ostertagi]
MLVVLLVALSMRCTSLAGVKAFYYEVQGSLDGINETAHDTGTVQRKLNSDILSALPRSDVVVRVDESDFDEHSNGAVFHGYVTTSIANRTNLVVLLQSVPTVIIVFLASR